MAHGQDARPIESVDGTPATARAAGNDGTVVLVLDPESQAALRAIQQNTETIANLLRLIVGGGE